jgi:hypothetical protein
MRTLIVFVLILLLGPLCFSATIKLKSGQTIEREILYVDEYHIKVDSQGMYLPYLLKEIDSINGKEVIEGQEPSLGVRDIGKEIGDKYNAATIYKKATEKLVAVPEDMFDSLLSKAVKD